MAYRVHNENGAGTVEHKIRSQGHLKVLCCRQNEGKGFPVRYEEERKRKRKTVWRARFWNIQSNTIVK